MTRTLSGLTARKSFVCLSGLLSLALLLFSGAVVYAQDTNAHELKHTEDSTFIDKEIFRVAVKLSPEPDTEKIASNTKRKIYYGMEAVKLLKKKSGASWKKFTDSITKTKDSKVKRAFDSISIYSCEIDPKGRVNIIVVPAVGSANSLSSQISLLDAATRRLGTDNPDNKKLRAEFLDVKRKYDESINDLAKIYVKAEANPNADQSVVAAVNSELGKGDDYFTERFRLEVSKLKNLISDADYQLKKVEIDDRYAQKYMLAAASFGRDDVARLLIEVAWKVHNLKQQVSALEKYEPVAHRWAMFIASALAFPLLGYLILRRGDNRANKKDEREEKDFEMREKEFEWRQNKEEREKTEFKWRQEEEEHKKAIREFEKQRSEDEKTLLRLKIKEQRNKLARQTKTSAKNKNRQNNK